MRETHPNGDAKAIDVRPLRAPKPPLNPSAHQAMISTYCECNSDIDMFPLATCHPMQQCNWFPKTNHVLGSSLTFFPKPSSFQGRVRLFVELLRKPYPSSRTHTILENREVLIQFNLKMRKISWGPQVDSTFG